MLSRCAEGGLGEKANISPKTGEALGVPETPLIPVPADAPALKAYDTQRLGAFPAHVITKALPAELGEI